MLRDVVTRAESLASTELIQGDEENVCDRRYVGHAIITNSHIYVYILLLLLAEKSLIRRFAQACSSSRQVEAEESSASPIRTLADHTGSYRVAKHRLNRKLVIKCEVQLEFVTSVLGFEKPPPTRGPLAYELLSGKCTVTW